MSTSVDQGIVTGEGVLLETRPVSFASRLLGALIDLGVLFVLLVVVTVLLENAQVVLDEQTTRIVGVLALVLVTVVVPTTVETLTRGRSLGKLAAGVRIVRDDGGPVLFRHAFVRALTGVVELWLTLGSVALICSVVHPRGKRVGDLLAGTYGVRVRSARTATVRASMPPALEGWATSADVARLPDGLALAVRQFLGRAPRLHPSSRIDLGERLVAQVRPYVSPDPPAGTHPEAYLSAVVAERRRRETLVEHARVAREQAEGALLHRLPHGVPDPAA